LKKILGELINFAGLGSPTQAWGGRAMQQSLCIIPGADIQHPALRHAMTMNTSIKLLIIKKLIKTTIIVKMVLGSWQVHARAMLMTTKPTKNIKNNNIRE